MAVPSPSSRSGTRVYLSFWDLFWAVVSPVLALYLRDPGIVFQLERARVLLAIFFGFCAGSLRRLGASGWHDALFFGA